MSVTTWTRLEPDNLGDHVALDLSEGVAAKLADPLWLLGRQWQLGELTGEDAGSPVLARVAASSFSIDRIYTRAGEVSFNAASVAAEAEIEADGAPADLRTRAAGGLIFLDRLDENGFGNRRASALERYRMDPGTGFETAPDGNRLLADLDAGTLASGLSIPGPERNAFAALAAGWAAWYRPRGGRRASGAFVADRLEYNFALGATVAEGRLSLDAAEHTGGRLEWDDFSTQAPSAAETPAAPKLTEVETIPLLLEIPGMPSQLFWEMEDPRFDPGSIDAGPSDTGRLLLVEAALAYSSDWFLVPLKLPVASLSRITSLLVTDTFGVTTIIPPVEEIKPHAGWRLWRVSDGGGGLPYLFLPPPSAGSLASEPVEEVVLARDEAANIAWGLHQFLPDALGRPRRVSPRPAPAPAQPPAGADLVYVPMAPLPDVRVPLALVENDQGRFLVRGRMANETAAAEPSGDLLPAGFRLRDEELVDDGLRLQRRFELGRTPDGVLHLWTSRAKQPGARLPGSGLVFDRIDSAGK